MSKPTIINYSLHLLASTTILIITSCGILTPNMTPASQLPPSNTPPPIITATSQLPTVAIPSYIHYAPSDGSNIRLEFDYPSSWICSQDLQDANFLVIGLGDPRFRTLPTAAPDDFHPTPNDFGSIVIWITPRKSGQSPETALEALKQSYNKNLRYKELKDYSVMIDGHDASALEYEVEPSPDHYPSVMFSRRVFFIVEDQLYEIYFSIAEKDRGGEFEQGYEY